MNLIEYPDRDMMMIDVAQHLADELAEHLMTHGTASFAVPGGTTPGPIFDVLCAADIDWDNVTVLLTDERWVPEDSEDSNTRLVRERLMTERAAKAHFLHYYRAGAKPKGVIGGLTTAIQPHLPISVLLLGMGPDMHTASLFPGVDALGTDYLNDNSPVFAPIKMPRLGKTGKRISLTVPVLDGAMSKHLVITGAEKRTALEQARQLGDPMVAPISAVLSGTTVHWAE